MVSKFPYIIDASCFVIPDGGGFDTFPDTGQKFDGLQRAARLAACEAYEVATRDTMVSLAIVDTFSSMFAEMGWFDESITLGSPDVDDPEDVFFLAKLVDLCSTYGTAVEDSSGTHYEFWMNVGEFVFPMHYYPANSLSSRFKVVVGENLLEDMFLMNSDGSFSLNWGQGVDFDVDISEIPHTDVLLRGYGYTTCAVDGALDTLQQGYEMAAAARVMALAAFSYTSDRVQDAKDFLSENLDIFRQTGREAVQEMLAYFDNLDFTSNSLYAALGTCQQYLKSFATATVSSDNNHVSFEGNAVITKPIFSLAWLKSTVSTVMTWVGSAMLIIQPIAGILVSLAGSLLSTLQTEITQSETVTISSDSFGYSLATAVFEDQFVYWETADIPPIVQEMIDMRLYTRLALLPNGLVMAIYDLTPQLSPDNALLGYGVNISLFLGPGNCDRGGYAVSGGIIPKALVYDGSIGPTPLVEPINSAEEFVMFQSINTTPLSPSELNFFSAGWNSTADYFSDSDFASMATLPTPSTPGDTKKIVSESMTKYAMGIWSSLIATMTALMVNQGSYKAWRFKYYPVGATYKLEFQAKVDDEWHNFDGTFPVSRTQEITKFFINYAYYWYLTTTTPVMTLSDFNFLVGVFFPKVISSTLSALGSQSAIRDTIKGALVSCYGHCNLLSDVVSLPHAVYPPEYVPGTHLYRALATAAASVVVIAGAVLVKRGIRKLAYRTRMKSAAKAQKAVDVARLNPTKANIDAAYKAQKKYALQGKLLGWGPLTNTSTYLSTSTISNPGDLASFAGMFSDVYDKQNGVDYIKNLIRP